MLVIDRCKPLKAKLYLGRKRSARTPYYRAFVFRDPHELRAFALEQSKLMLDPAACKAAYWKNCLGCARHFGTGVPHRPRQVGVVLLCRQALGVGVVSHEMTHAALYHVTRRTRRGWPVKLTQADDERLAWHQGNLVRQFYNWYWRQKGARAET